jgi:hypothetical protein
MSYLYVTELASLAQSELSGGAVLLGRLPEITTQKIAVSGTSAASNAFNQATQVIRVHTDTICSICVSPQTPAATTPPAAATNMRLAANQTEYFAVTPGQYISVISNT